MIRIPLSVVVVVVALVGCGPPPADGTDTFLIFDRDSETGDYRLFERTIETLDNLEEGKGQLADLRAGGDIRLGNSAPQTREQYANSIRVDNAKSPQLDYTVRDDGVVVPWDFHTAMMLTLYHHLEKANYYFRDLGISQKTMGKIPIFYYARLRLILPIDLMTDNAAYAFTMDAMLLPPNMLSREIPFAANRGIIVHEYSHLIFNRLVHDDARVPDYLVGDWPGAAVNRMRSIDEGVADIFAGLQTRDPNFISSSVSEELFDVERDMSIPRTYTEALAENVETTGREEYNPYELGAVIASTVWTLRSQTSVDDDQLARSLLATLRGMSQVGPDLTVAGFFNRFADRLPSENAGPACSIFHTRLEAIQGELTCDT